MAEQWKNKQSSKISFLLKKSKLTLYLNANYAYNIYIYLKHMHIAITQKKTLAAFKKHIEEPLRT